MWAGSIGIMRFPPSSTHYSILAAHHSQYSSAKTTYRLWPIFLSLFFSRCNKSAVNSLLLICKKDGRMRMRLTDWKGLNNLLVSDPLQLFVYEWMVAHFPVYIVYTHEQLKAYVEAKNTPFVRLVFLHWLAPSTCLELKQANMFFSFFLLVFAWYTVLVCNIHRMYSSQGLHMLRVDSVYTEPLCIFIRLLR